jgi:hypothetical protein
MKTRNLGRLEVPRLGFGNMGLSGGHYGPGVDWVDEIKSADGNAIGVLCDMSDESQVRASGTHRCCIRRS